MPEFAERTEAHERAKAERLAPGVEDALRRPDPPRIADPATRSSRWARARRRLRPSGHGAPTAGRRRMRRRLEKGGEAAFARFVHRASDHRLERTVGSDPGLRVVFSGWHGASAPTRRRASAATSNTSWRRRRGGEAVGRERERRAGLGATRSGARARGHDRDGTWPTSSASSAATWIPGKALLDGS
jgi:hypothetical protein